MVIRDMSYTFEDGGRYLLSGSSGSGKTTLLRTIMQLQRPTSGTVTFEGDAIFSCVFQEDRLIESLSAVENIRITSPSLSIDDIRKELTVILPEDSLDKPVSRLSGGMRRRVCIVRACLAESNILIMDEPLTGLDGTNRKNVLEYITDRLNNRIFITASHSELFSDLCDEITLQESV